MYFSKAGLSPAGPWSLITCSHGSIQSRWLLFRTAFVLLSGSASPQQMLDLCKSCSSLVVCNVQLPDRNLGAVLPDAFQTFSEEPIPGLAPFLDAYVTSSDSMIYMSSPLTLEDWNAIVRANQLRPFRVHPAVGDAIPPGAFDSHDFKSQKSLSGIQIVYLLVSDIDEAVKCLESDIEFMQLSLIDERWMWDVAFALPHVTRTLPDAGMDERPFDEQAEYYHWAYTRNDQGNITHLWLPSIDQVTQHSGEMQSVHTLRFDRRGFMGMQSIQALDFSDLKKLPNLRRLYFDDEEYFGDLVVPARPAIAGTFADSSTRSQSDGCQERL